MQNHDSPQLTEEPSRERSAACTRVPSPFPDGGTHTFPGWLGARVPAAERNAFTATATPTPTPTPS